MAVKFESLVINQGFYKNVIEHYLNNPEDVKLHNHVVSLTVQIKRFICQHTQNPNIHTLRLFLKCNMPELLKYCFLIWDNWDTKRKAFEATDGNKKLILTNYTYSI